MAEKQQSALRAQSAPPRPEGRGLRVKVLSDENATHRRTALWHIVRHFFEQDEVLLTPTIAVPPFAIGVDFPLEIAGRLVSSPLAWFLFTVPFAMTGQPAISVPCGWTRGGLPVGLQIVGRRFADATVLAAAHMFEAACRWTHRRPSL